MEIKDNDKGFEVNRVAVAKRHKRWGRLGIRERVEPLGDSVAVVSAPGQGNRQARPDSTPQQSLREDVMPAPSIEKTATAIQRQERIRPRLAKKLIMAMAGSSGRLGRIAAHPIGASLCLALGYMVLCSAYIFFSGRIAAGAAWSIDQLRDFELVKGLAFVIITGAGYFGFAAFLLKRIDVQQQHLALIFQGVSDCLFLLEVEADDCYRFLCINAAFLKMTGLTREQVVGKRIEDVLPGTSDARVRSKCREAIRERKTVSWEASATYPVGQIVGEVTVTPLADKTGAVIQLAGIIRDVTERKQVEDEVRQLSGSLLRSRDEERRRIGRELHDSTAQELLAVSMNLDLVQQRYAGRDVTTDNLLADSQAIIAQSQRELATLSYQLHPPALDELGLAGAVQEYAAGFTQRSGIKVTLDTSPALGRLPAETERALFRVVQESLGNVHRHSGSSTATIRIARENGDVVLEVTDQGCGLRVRGDGTVPKAGVGLAGMRERVRQLGGRFEIESSGRGTTVRAIAPGEVVADEDLTNPDRR
ncbi:MAG: PAS domain-containing protein [Verrucomicrobiia bacterium]|jgi:PAS domain S-box-containing protein